MIHSNPTYQLWTKIGAVFFVLAILGGVSLAATQSLVATQTTIKPAVKLPDVKENPQVEKPSQDPAVTIKQEGEQSKTGDGTVSSTHSSTVQHEDGSTNVSVSNNSSQSAQAGNGGNAAVTNSTTTTVNISH